MHYLLFASETNPEPKGDNMFEVLKTRISAWRRYNRTVSELNALTNRELADLGMMRSDIQRVARQAVRT
jgi:uncharacterized protein YjiS (DUF1127 family)